MGPADSTVLRHFSALSLPRVPAIYGCCGAVRGEAESEGVEGGMLRAEGERGGHGRARTSIELAAAVVVCDRACLDNCEAERVDGRVDESSAARIRYNVTVRSNGTCDMGNARKCEAQGVGELVPLLDDRFALTYSRSLPTGCGRGSRLA